MRWTKTLIPTLKEDPQDAETKSHKLMIRAGLIRKLSSGVYSYLPLGWRVLKKIEDIIRREMDSAGAVELLLPALQPVELWVKSGRISALGEDMISFVDRHKKQMVLGPTHEEIITNLVSNEVKSYRQMPITLYQIQNKFRDEVRPRFGILRSREFIMKDAYSFDTSTQALDKSYKLMFDAYCKLFSKCGLKFEVVEADTGIMGGDVSHEFMVLAEKGEDKICLCNKCSYSASLDAAKYDVNKIEYPEEEVNPTTFVDTPDICSIDDVCSFLKISPKKMVKTLIYTTDNGGNIAVLIRGDFDVNQAKLTKHLKLGPVRLSSEEEIKKLVPARIGFLGPVGLRNVRTIADFSVKGLKNFISGANENDKHLVNINTGRDFQVEEYADIRNVVEADKCPKCDGELCIKNAIEVGHVFKLGTKYSVSMDAKYLDADGKEKPIIMGCYGIGVNRIMACSIELYADKDGIVWPEAISPFLCHLIPLNLTNEKIKLAADSLYETLCSKTIEVLYDDRDERPGIKFKDADLIGIPYQIILGRQFEENAMIELKHRHSGKREFISEKDLLEKLSLK